MNASKTLFVQIMDFVPWTSFAHIVQRHSGNAGVRTLSCAEQFRAMAFAQLTRRESLRDIETSLSANANKLYAMGFRSAADLARNRLDPLPLRAVLDLLLDHQPNRPFRDFLRVPLRRVHDSILSKI